MFVSVFDILGGEKKPTQPNSSQICLTLASFSQVTLTIVELMS